MAHADLVNSLIATYRTLNLAIRPMPADRALQPGPDGKSLRSLIHEMRDHELLASQQLKAMTLADISAPSEAGEVVVAEPTGEQSVHVLLSEFGTAREAILAQIREMTDEEWEQERRGPKGPTTIQAFIAGLVDHDRQMMQQVEPLLGVRSG